jgi:hypothetical protein
VVKTLVATPDPKRPKIIHVEWTNFDEWDNNNPRRFGAWVSHTALQAFVGSLQTTEAWDVEVRNV